MPGLPQRLSRDAWLLAGVLLVASSTLLSTAQAQEEPSGSGVENRARDLKSDVLEWVDQLDASQLSQRKAAEIALIEAGPEALQYLPATQSSRSIEANQRLLRVREALEAMRTEAQAAAVRVQLDEVSSLSEALEAISRDSGVEFEYEGDLSVPIKPVTTPLSFWHAVDVVLDQARLDINFYGGDRTTLQLVTRTPQRPSRVDSAAYTGVYRIEPTAVTARRVLNQPTLSGLNVSIEISWEPRLTPIGLTIPLDQISGRLSNSAELLPQESGETIDIATNSDISFSEFFLPMQLPAGQPESIESISGVIRALLPGERQRFELPLADLATEKKIDAMTVIIEDIRQNGPLYEIRVGIELDNAGRSLESHRQWIFENDAFVRRADGSRADHLGYEVYRQTAAGVGIGYLFDLGGDLSDLKLVYESPTAVVETEVPFVIQEIPLP